MSLPSNTREPPSEFEKVVEPWKIGRWLFELERSFQIVRSFGSNEEGLLASKCKVRLSWSMFPDYWLLWIDWKVGKDNWEKALNEIINKIYLIP